MNTEPNATLWVMVWIVAAGLVIVRHWRTDWGVGLVLTYIVSFGTFHWLVPLFSLLPWYARHEELSAEGLRMSALAVIAFWVGSEVVTLLRGATRLSLADVRHPRSVLTPRLVTIYFLGGSFLYGVITPIAGRLPTISAVVSTGATLMAVGVALKCWNAWQERRTWALLLWFSSIALFPVITVVTQGFLGYGFAASLLVAIFVASFHRPQLKEVALGVLAAYVGISIYVTYMRDRDEIRSVVWGGASVTDRLVRLQDSFENFEWFNPYDFKHLDRLSKRLDQDYLIGAAVLNLEDRLVPFAEGATLRDAAVALIPRAIWNNKPVVGGSGDIVSTYTGFRFAEGTSVGAGQVLEFYVNFGTAGVLVGFLIIGILVTYVDRRAGAVLLSGDARIFVLWYLPGLSLLQVGGSLAEIVATAGASFVLATILNVVTRPLPVEPDVHSLTPSDPSDVPAGNREVLR